MAYWCLLLAAPLTLLPGQTPGSPSGRPVIPGDWNIPKNGSATDRKNDKPANVVLPMWAKVKPGHTLYQQLVVTQKPRYSIQGLSFNSQLRYSIVSQLTITKRLADDRLVVEQKILAAQLEQADSMTRPLLAPAVKQLPGTTFSIVLSPNRQVVEFKGYANKVRMAAPQFGLAQGLQVVSLLDEDGWKELTNATFFFPDPVFFHGKKWVRPMTHSWGPLGSWRGLVHYFPAGEDKDIQRIGYFYQMKYQPPLANKGRLPIMQAAFQPQQSKGYIYFDSKKGRVAGIEEYFRVRGMLTLRLLGQRTPVAMEEEQGFQIRLLDHNPLRK